MSESNSCCEIPTKFKLRALRVGRRQRRIKPTLRVISDDVQSAIKLPCIERDVKSESFGNNLSRDLATVVHVDDIGTPVSLRIHRFWMKDDAWSSVTRNDRNWTADSFCWSSSSALSASGATRIVTLEKRCFRQSIRKRRETSEQTLRVCWSLDESTSLRMTCKTSTGRDGEEGSMGVQPLEH